MEAKQSEHVKDEDPLNLALWVAVSAIFGLLFVTLLVQ